MKLNICYFFICITVYFFSLTSELIFSQDVQLGWTVTDYPYVSHYGIYRKSHPDSSFRLIATVPHPDSTYRDSDIQPGKTYYYVATTFDQYGNESMFSNMVDTTIAGHVTYEFPTQGWYLISIPVNPTNSLVNVLFPNALGGIAYSWDHVQNNYVQVNTLESGKGYWLAISGPSTVEVSGTSVYLYTQNFTQGWHMIGSVLGGANFASPDDDPDGSAFTPAYGWNPQSESYYSTTNLQESEGYWVAIWAACDLTISSNLMLKVSLSGKNDTTNWRDFTALRRI